MGNAWDISKNNLFSSLFLQCDLIPGWGRGWGKCFHLIDQLSVGVTESLLQYFFFSVFLFLKFCFWVSRLNRPNFFLKFWSLESVIYFFFNYCKTLGILAAEHSYFDALPL